MNHYYLVRFSKKTGKTDILMDSKSCAMLKLWALQNTTKTKGTLIYDASGLVLCLYEGTETFPKVMECPETPFCWIDEFCDELYEELVEGGRG